MDIPSDDDLRTMEPDALNALAAGIVASGEEEAIEELKSALLRIHQAWRDGAHSEKQSNRTDRAAHIRSERPLPEDHPRNYVSLSGHDIHRVLMRAWRTELSGRAKLVWYLADELGWTHARIVDALKRRGVKCSQSTVSRLLRRAREDLKCAAIERDPYNVFWRESHRSAYFEPDHRPKLPEGVEEARESMEAAKGIDISTHIMPEALSFVEEWQNGERQLDDEKKPVGKPVSSLKRKVRTVVLRKRIVAQAKKKMGKVSPSLHKTLKK